MSYFQSYPSASQPGQLEPQQQTAPAEGLSGGSCCLLFGGMAQILLGIVSIAIGSVVLTTGDIGMFNQIYIPIWGGSIFMIAGIIGVASICIPSLKSCMMGFYLAFSAISLLVALGQTGWEGWVAWQYSDATKLYCDIPVVNSLGLQDFFDSVTGITCDDIRLVYYLRIASSVIGGIEAIVALISAIYACTHVCCYQDDEPEKMTMAGQTNFGADPYTQNSAFGQTPSYPSYPTNTVTSFPAGTMNSFPAGTMNSFPASQMSSYPRDTMASYSASRYTQNPGSGPSYAYNGYPQSSNVYYDGGKASYRSDRYM